MESKINLQNKAEIKLNPELSIVQTNKSLWSSSKNMTSLLGIVQITVFDKFNNAHKICPILDCGSQSSYITNTSRVFELLGLDSELNIIRLGICR